MQPKPPRREGTSPISVRAAILGDSPQKFSRLMLAKESSRPRGPKAALIIVDLVVQAAFPKIFDLAHLRSSLQVAGTDQWVLALSDVASVPVASLAMYRCRTDADPLEDGLA